MRVFVDYQGNSIRFTEERRYHALKHPEMRDLEHEIELALSNPDLVMESGTDRTVQLYYRFLLHTLVGDKWLCVVVKFISGTNFVLTAYVTDRPKQGRLLWRTSP
jgi:hypothetical protein